MCASGASAQPVLAEAGRAAVTTADVQGEAIRLPIPVENRKDALGNPDSVRQIADNLLVRRALAQKAEEAGLAQNEAVQAAIRIARDRVLSDAMIERIDAASKPKPEVIDALAQTNYKANPKRFDLPEETGARHILIATATPDAKAKAEKVLADLKAGASFEKLAREQSQDPGSAVKGGDLGYFGKGRMVAPFEAALDKLQKPGEMSDVVETQFGYHIIKLEGRRSAGVRPFEQVREVLRAEAEAKLRNDARMAEVQRIREGAKFNQSAIEAFAASQK